MYIHPRPVDFNLTLHAPLSRHSEPTQVPFGLALCLGPTHSYDPRSHRPIAPDTFWPFTLWPTVPRSLCLSCHLGQLCTPPTLAFNLWNVQKKTHLFRELVFWCMSSVGKLFPVEVNEDRPADNRKMTCPLFLSRLPRPFKKQIFNSASHPLYLNVHLSYLSITPFQSIFIFMSPHSLSQSIFLPREHGRVSGCLFLSSSLLFFSVCLRSALWETLKGLCYKLQSLPWWPALTDSS